MLAAVIRSASLSSRDKGDPYNYFRLLCSMKLRCGPVVWALIVCRSVTGPIIQGCFAAQHALDCAQFPVICTKLYGPLPSTLSLRTASSSFVRLQDGSRSIFHFVLREFEVDRRTELWSSAGKLSKAFELQPLDHCNQSFLICFGRIMWSLIANACCTLFLYSSLVSWLYFVTAQAIC